MKTDTPTGIQHPSESIMRTLIREAWDDEKGIVAAVIDPDGNIVAKDEATIWAGLDGVVYANNPDYRGRQDDWSFIKCRDVLNAGAYIHEVQLHEDFLLDEMKDYFLVN